MHNEEVTNNVKDLLARVQGIINILRKPDVPLAERKLQGVRDKLVYMLNKSARGESIRDDAERLLLQLQEVSTDQTEVLNDGDSGTRS